MGGMYRRFEGFAKSATAQLDPRQRLAVVAAIGDRAIAAAAEYPLDVETTAAVELAWLALDGTVVGRDEIKARAFAIREAYDAHFDEMRGVEQYAVRAAEACLEVLDEARSGAALEAAADALANVVNNAVVDAVYDEVLLEELAWLKSVVVKAAAGIFRREDLSWPSVPAPAWLVRRLADLEPDADDPDDLAEQQAALPAVLARAATEHATAFSKQRAVQTFPAWREPSGLPEGLQVRPFGKGQSSTEGKIITSGHQRFALFDGQKDRLLFAPSASVALGMNPERTCVYSWRVEHASGSGIGRGDYDWILERYRWPERTLIDSYSIMSRDVIAWCSPVKLHVPGAHGGRVVVLKACSEDYERKVYVAYGARGPIGETLDADAVDALLECEPESDAPAAEPARLTATDLPRLFAKFPEHSEDFSARSECERLLPEVLALSELPAERLEDSVPFGLLLARVAGFLQTKASYDTAEQLARRSLRLLERLLGKSDARLLRPLGALGRVLNAREVPRQAKPILQRALELAEASHGPSSPEVATALTDLGTSLYLNGDTQACIELFRRSLTIREAVYPQGHPEIGVGTNDLGALISDDEPEAGEALLRRALEIRRAAYGARHPDVAITLDNLASLLDDQDRGGEAAELAAEAVTILEECHGRHHPDVAIALSNMASRLEGQGKYSAADPYRRRALAAKEAVFGVPSPAVGEAYRHLGICLYRKRELREAQQCFRCALAVDRAVHGESHLDVASDLNWLGTALEASGAVAEAEPLFRSSLQLVQELVEAPHRRLATAFNNLANNRKLAQQLDEACDLYLQALENYEGSNGTPANSSSVHNALAQVLLGKQELEKAERHARLALQIDEELHGPEHEELSGTLIWLGRILSAQGRHDEAAAALRRAVAIDEKVYGASSSDVVTDLSWLGRALLDGERWSEAEPVYRRMLSIALERRNRHRDVAAAQDKLALVLFELEQVDASEVLLREALSFYEAHLGDYLDELEAAYGRMARVLETLGRDAEASLYRAKAAKAAERAETAREGDDALRG